MSTETRKPFVPNDTQLVQMSLGGVVAVFFMFKWLGPGKWGLDALIPVIIFAAMSLLNGRGQRLRMFATFVVSFAGLTYLRFHLTAFGLVVAVLSQFACLAIVQRYPPQSRI